MNALTFLTYKSQTAYLNADCTLRQAIEKLKYHKFSAIPLVSSNGKYVGVLTKEQLLGWLGASNITDITQTEKIKISAIIKGEVYRSCSLNVSFAKVISLLLTQRFVPITDDRGIYCGVISRKKIFDYCLKESERLCKKLQIDNIF